MAKKMFWQGECNTEIERLRGLLRRGIDSEEYLVKHLNEKGNPCTVGSWVSEAKAALKEVKDG